MAKYLARLRHAHENQAMQKIFTLFQETWVKIGLNDACNNRQEECLDLLYMDEGS
jgi:hypothetical protein